jgi:hypothetical protein
MKYLVISFLFGLACVSNNAHGMSIYSSLARNVVALGLAIEGVQNVPLLGKLTNFLPCGVVAFCLKEYPGHTMAMLGGLFAYALSHSDSIRSLLIKYNIINPTTSNATLDTAQDDTLFIFDGDDADDAEEQMDTEDELLDDEYANDAPKNTRTIKRHADSADIEQSASLSFL